MMVTITLFFCLVLFLFSFFFTEPDEAGWVQQRAFLDVTLRDVGTLYISMKIRFK